MADTAMAPSGLELVTDAGETAHPRISWGAIFGGGFAALGLWLLLYAFGLAIGLSAVDPQNPGSLRGSGIFTGIWGLVSPLIALFVGGVVAGHAAGVRRRGEGALHGLVMWGLATVAGAAFAFSVAAAMISGVASAGKALAQAGASGIANAAGAAAGNAGGLGRQMGLDANDLLGPVNQRLRAAGKPTVTADQLGAVAQDAAQQALRTGRIDRDVLVRSVTEHTQLSRADAEQIADEAQQRVDAATQQIRGTAQGIASATQDRALRAADATGKAFWWMFGALGLGLVAALAGGATGAPRRTTSRRDRRADATVPPRTAVAPPVAPAGVPSGAPSRA